MKVQNTDPKVKLLDISKNLSNVVGVLKYNDAIKEKAIEFERYLKECGYSNPISDMFFNEVAGVVNEPCMISDIMFQFYKNTTLDDELLPYQIHIQGILRESAALGQITTIGFLLTIGADINYALSGGETPLSGAMLNYHESVIKFLLNNGAKINVQDISGYTPIVCLISNNKPSPEFVQFLIDKDADPRIPTVCGTILENEGTNDPEIIRILLDASARLDARDAAAALGALEHDE